MAVGGFGGALFPTPEAVMARDRERVANDIEEYHRTWHQLLSNDRCDCETLARQIRLKNYMSTTEGAL